jgi:hypothetical protein
MHFKPKINMKIHPLALIGIGLFAVYAYKQTKTKPEDTLTPEERHVMEELRKQM